MKTAPIYVWPTRKFGARAGYSAAHFARLAGEQDDPLRTAARIDAQRISSNIYQEVQARLGDGEDRDEVLAWASAEESTISQARWARLCESFALVVEVLESAVERPGVKAMLVEAKRQQKRALSQGGT